MGLALAFLGLAMSGAEAVDAPLPALELRRLAARRGQVLQYLTITWNSVECLVALIAGILEGSVAPLALAKDDDLHLTYSHLGLDK